MNEERICRRCLLVQSGREDTLEEITKHLEKIPGKEKATADEYSGRLEICKDCDYLNVGTCLKCGCYPEFRAAFKKNRCPVKKW